MLFYFRNLADTINMCVYIHTHTHKLIWYTYICIAIVQLLSHTQLFASPWTAALQTSLSFTIFQSLPKFMSIESMMLYNHLILYCPLLLFQSFPASGCFPMSWFFASGGQSIVYGQSVCVCVYIYIFICMYIYNAIILTWYIHTGLRRNSYMSIYTYQNII